MNKDALEQIISRVLSEFADAQGTLSAYPIETVATAIGAAVMSEFDVNVPANKANPAFDWGGGY